MKAGGHVKKRKNGRAVSPIHQPYSLLVISFGLSVFNKELDPVGLTVRYEVMKLCPGSA